MSNAATIYITVLMPAYNAAKYIDEAIESVLAQSFKNFELLIINDGSTDDTGKIINGYTDERVIVKHIEHSGVSKALNKGLSIAKGKYIARFDADDICLPERLEKQFQFLEQHPDYVLTGSDAFYIMEDGSPLFSFNCRGYTDNDIRSKLFVFCPVIHSAVMFRKQAVIDAGGYSLYAHNFEDYLLWVQLAGTGKLHNIPEPLIKVRFNPSSVTIDEKWRGKQFRDLKRSIIKRGDITEQEGMQLLAIIQTQNNLDIKEGAYHALCAKKFLTDNYEPGKARKHILNAIAHMPSRWDSYAIFLVSFFPRSFINWLHRRSPNKL